MLRSLSRAPALVRPVGSISRRLTSSGVLLDSDSDFKPQLKSPSSSSAQSEMEKAKSVIESHVKANPIMLYMKGSPSAPQCGFSARVVRTIQNHDVPFSSVNVLEYPAIREGIKQYSDWPTIPQLYVGGEFIGGCDIVEGMEEDGELEAVLKAAVATAKE